MDKLIKAVQSQRENLEGYWKQLPADRKRKLVGYAFMLYCIITLIVIIQVIGQVGNNTQTVAIEHIENSVVKLQQEKK
ncbi:hypothetical protein V1389_01655 [Flavobacterium rakeshii]|uniref:hypothetical protein n=1 Tax=Flavobacterium rakeshii TaxID=1038845 RepID=UPI002E7BBF1A|nr:hypothetical protein [Flavobacterium rakeshii]MEE1897022.1 hypothetical protein [Flavobacterium rakeshii]